MKKPEKKLKVAYIRRRFWKSPERIFYELVFHDDGKTFVSKLEKKDLSWTDSAIKVEATEQEILTALKGLGTCGKNMQDVLRQMPRLILQLPESMRDDALWAESIHNMPILIESAGSITAPMVYAYCSERKDQVCAYINSLTDEELNYGVDSGTIWLNQIPGQRLTKNLVHMASLKILKENHDILLSDCRQVGDGFKDAYFYQCLCAVNGYNFRLVPKELRDQVVNMRLIEYSIENQKSFIGIYHLYSSLTDEEKTEEISLKCCLKHFSCMELLPECLKNEAFYCKLLDAGMNRLLEECDYASLSKKIFLRGMDVLDKNNHLKKIPASLLCQETAMKAAEFMNGMDVLPARYRNYDTWMCHIKVHGHHIDKVPEQFLTEDMCVEAYCSHPFRTMDLIPEQFRTPSFYGRILDNGSYYLSDIPEKYLSQELVIRYIQKDHPDNLEGIPEKYRIPEIVSAIAENSDVRFLRIPKDYQTPELCSRITRRMLDEMESWLQFGVFYRQMKYQEEEISLLLVEHLERGLEFIHPQSRKVIERSLELYPDSIVDVEQWWFESDRLDAADHTDDLGEESIPLQTTCPHEMEQLTLFDFLDF